MFLIRTKAQKVSLDIAGKCFKQVLARSYPSLVPQKHTSFQTRPVHFSQRLLCDSMKHPMASMFVHDLVGRQGEIFVLTPDSTRVY